MSRRQCRIALEEGVVSVRDLSSRNPILVNGRVVNESVLEVGDEIAMGASRLIFTKVANNPEHQEKPGTSAVTWSWNKGAVFCVDIGALKPGPDTLPGTVQDLALLYDTTRELSAALGITALRDVFAARLRSRFKPIRGWLALTWEHEESGLGAFDAFEGDAPHPGANSHAEQALRERKGILSARKDRAAVGNAPVFSLVSAIPFGDRSLGAVALETQAPQGAYDEGDLKFLVLLCRAVAPLIQAVRSMEELRRDNEWLRMRAGESMELLGESTAIRRVCSEIMRAAKTDGSVLVTGETGTGKELAARRIHTLSRRRSQPFVVVNCAAIPQDMFESQIFGYEAGAFTGAREAFEGLLAQAHTGTLLLDEAGDLSPDNQARVLRAVELGTFRRLGAKDETHVDIRVIAATNKDMARAVEEGRFRKDLYHRLNTFEIHMPPLRLHPSDIPILANHFFARFRHEAKRPVTGISAGAMKYLCAHSWPGNVRELRNRIQRAVAVARKKEIQEDDVRIQPNAQAILGEFGAPLSLAEAEKRYIKEILLQTGGNIQQTAKLLQISRTTLYAKLNEYNIR